MRPRWVTHHTSVTGGETLTHWVASTCFALGGTAACVASAASSIALLAALEAAFLGLGRAQVFPDRHAREYIW